MAKKDLDNTLSLVYNKTTKTWTRNGQPIKEGYKYFDTNEKRTKVFTNNTFVNENDYRFDKAKSSKLKNEVLRTAISNLSPTLRNIKSFIDIAADLGTKHSGGSGLPDGTRYTGLHRFGNNKHTNLLKNRSTIISGENARGNQAILNYYLYGDDSKLNKSTQEPIRLKGNNSFDYPNVDYNFLPVDTLTLTEEWKNTIDKMANKGLYPIDNWYFVDDNDRQAVNIRERPRYKDKTVYDYGRASAKFIKDKQGNYSLRTIDKFDTGKTVGPLGITLETLKKTNPLIVRHDNPIKFIKTKDANHFNQDNDLLYNLMFRE